MSESAREHPWKGATHAKEVSERGRRTTNGVATHVEGMIVWYETVGLCGW
jgi:hypothetical protein